MGCDALLMHPRSSLSTRRPSLRMALPTELWDVIFTDVCDLRGKNAATVSQVSRSFRQAIAPYRLRSLVIYGEGQIEAFHEAVKKMPPDVPRARHLFIGLIPYSAVKDTRPVCDAVIDGWVQHRKETQVQREDRIRQDTILLRSGEQPERCARTQRVVVAKIISQHSATLQTLTYLTPVNNISFHTFGCLPHLKDLSIVSLRRGRLICYQVYSSDPLHRQTQFPSLERLHLSYIDNKLLFRHDEFRRVAPNLRHLRLSDGRCELQFEKLHPHTKVLIQMPLMSRKEQGVQVSHMREILSDERYRQRVVWLGLGYREDGRYGFFDALLDWLDVSTGGNAFWGATDQITVDELAAR
jgi:hypothetical protein